MNKNSILRGKKIGVLMGGISSERNISLKSGKAVCHALKNKKCNVIALDLKTENKKSISSILKKARVDVVFIALHGHFGEDGGIQSILDELNIPYTGSGKIASRLAMDKIASRRIFMRNNISVPDFLIVNGKRKYFFWVLSSYFLSGL